MYEILDRSSGNVMGIRLSGKLTHAQYKDLVPKLEGLIERFGKIRIVLELNAFEGWDMQAALDDIIFAFRNSMAIERMAIVIDTEADEWALLVDQPFARRIRGKEKIFKPSELKDAWRWAEKAKTTVLAVDPQAYKESIRYGSDMRILINGGGIAGLTLAALLERRGFSPKLIEKQASYEPLGHVLTLWPSASNVLKGLGLFPSVLEKAMPFREYQVFDAKNRQLHRYSTEALAKKYGTTYTIYRPDLINILRGSLSDTDIRMATTIKRIKQSNEFAKVRLSDDAEEFYDLVVSCEGTDDRLRKLVFGKGSHEASFAHTWGFWADPDLLPEGNILEYWGDGKVLRLCPSKGRLFAFVCLNSPPKHLSDVHASIQEAFKDFSGHVPAVLQSMQGLESIDYGDFEQLNLDEWYKGRALILSETGRVALAAGGLGASLAFESVSVLAGELGRTDSCYIDRALANYVARRSHRIQSIQRLSRHYGRLAWTNSSLKTRFRDRAAQLFAKDPFTKFWDAILSEPL